ncbi:helix-turn-helix domain-containing protein [Streptomyces sp. TP-A0874]|uniref:helix-turn-helix domain-containing protein n=1 Tax=Streptomyces sp. TP-A0874 TaxID=549819 RepID=UPI00147FDD8F|nr:winged helix-turn-helix domain-containing protein [Streptomyces sp. TP-A0874]
MGELPDASTRGAVLQAMRDYSRLISAQRGAVDPRLGELVKLVCGFSITEQGLGKWLRRHGFTPQRPARRPYRQQPAQVRAWLNAPGVWGIRVPAGLSPGPAG